MIWSCHLCSHFNKRINDIHDRTLQIVYRCSKPKFETFLEMMIFFPLFKSKSQFFSSGHKQKFWAFIKFKVSVTSSIFLVRHVTYGISHPYDTFDIESKTKSNFETKQPSFLTAWKVSSGCCCQVRKKIQLVPFKEPVKANQKLKFFSGSSRLFWSFSNLS